MTGTPEDAERAWAEWDAQAEYFDDPSAWARDAFLAGYAARPSVTVDEITELLAGHTQRLDFRADYLGCKCGQRPSMTEHRAHVASVIVAHITGEGGRND